MPCFPAQIFPEEKVAPDYRSCAGSSRICFLSAHQGKRTSWKAGTKEKLQACLKGSPREGDNNVVSLAISSFVLWSFLLLILEHIQMLCNSAEQTVPALIQSLRRSRLAITMEIQVLVAKFGEDPWHHSCDNWETGSLETIYIPLARVCLLAKRL